ncbi:MAG: RICIN domain-containing protein [Oligoflexales bacterium]
MILSRGLIAIGIWSLISAGCITRKDKANNEAAGPSTIAANYNSSAGEIIIPVPKDLPDGKTFSAFPSNSNRKPNILNGLNLADETWGRNTSGNVESMDIKCFAPASFGKKEDWYFFAQVLSGDSVRTEQDFQLDNCGDIQINARDLDISQTYVVRAQFYYSTDDKTIVYYEGTSKPFKPQDRSLDLILEKKRIDQDVEVDVQKTESEICMENGHKWTGRACVGGDAYATLRFAHSDLCLTESSDGRLFQATCDGTTRQQLKLILRFKASTYDPRATKGGGLYSLQFQKSKLCLTAISGKPQLRDCLSGAASAELRSAQAFRLDWSGKTERFQMVALPVESSTCLTVESNLLETSPVDFGSCNRSGSNETNRFFYMTPAQ